MILVRQETSPEDVHGMAVAEGILTSRGGLVSHAAVVARGWGKPAVCGAEAIAHRRRRVRRPATSVVREGDVISIDGSTGRVDARRGRRWPRASLPRGVRRSCSAGPTRSAGARCAVRANADTGPDAAKARQFGAEGIGLCRTEHMFLGEDRLPVVRRMILARRPEEERPRSSELLEVQRADFEEVLEAMDGLPVTVRLLDPPLHEFLPQVEELAIAGDAKA